MEVVQADMRNLKMKKEDNLDYSKWMRLIRGIGARTEMECGGLISSITFCSGSHEVSLKSTALIVLNCICGIFRWSTEIRTFLLS